MFHPSGLQSPEDKRDQRTRNLFWLGYMIGVLSGAVAAVSYLLDVPLF